MMMKNFAVLIGLLSIVLLAGCMAEGQETYSHSELLDNVETAYDQGKETGYKLARTEFQTREETIAARTDTSTIDIQEGRYQYFSVNTTHESELSYRVLQYAGPRFDVFVVNNDNLDKVDRGVDFEQFANCSDWYSRTVERICDLPAGAWHIVIDNTDQGGAVPEADQNGDTTVRLQFTFEVVREIKKGGA